ncbi:hypothetical protein [Gemmobacter lutimaris]|uniref:hypothetical protein n=1 Tax=Gemmobacter lutimaris TaxID=2306023 RepID=UPI0011C48583|nr:hypothetical protein [Gemmobacter lutimaris]
MPAINPPFRLKILTALTEVLKTITPANGYQMDLSTEADGTKRVVRGRLFIGDDDPGTLVSLVEPPVAHDNGKRRAPDNHNRDSQWEVLIQGWAKNDRDNEPCDWAYVLAADVQRALALELAKTQTRRPGAPDILGMGGRLLEMRIGAPVVRPTEEVSNYGVFYLILDIKIVEDMANPFG